MSVISSIVSSQVTHLRRLLIALIVSLVSLSLWGGALVAPAQAADANDYYTNDRGSLQTTERYDQIQPEAGGMNGFDAVDPRRDIQEADAKARKLSDSAKRRQLGASDPLTPARETIDSIKETVKRTASDLAD